MKRLVKVLGTIIFSLIIIIAIGGYLFVRNFDLNHYKSYVEEIADKQLGRKLAINGNAYLGLSLIPTLIVEDVELANAAWAAQPQMAKIERLEIKLSLMPLLHKQLVIDNVEVVKPEVYLETSAEGKNNWDFATKPVKSVPVRSVSTFSLISEAQALEVDDKAATSANPVLPFLEGIAAKNVSVSSGLVQYANAKTGKVMNIIINSFNLSAESMDDNITTNFDVDIDGQAVKGSAVLGSVNALLNGKDAYPFDVDVNAYGIDLTAVGSARDLFADVSYAANINVYNPAGNMQLPETTLKAQVEGTTQEVKAQIAVLNIVNNLIKGNVSANIAGQVPVVEAALQSDKINLESFNPQSNMAFEMPSLISTAEASPLVPDTAVPYDMLKEVNAKLDLQVGQLIINSGMSAQNVELKADLQNGLLKVNPLKLNFGGGEIDGQLEVNANTKTIQLDVLSSNILLQNLHKEFQVSGKDDFGIVSGGNTDIKMTLTAAGKTYRQLVQSLNGQVIAIVNKSEVQTGNITFFTGSFISQLLSVLPVEKKSQQKLNLDCAVVRADLGAGQAVFPKGIAMQSDLFNLGSSGSINLINDKIDFDVRPSSGKLINTNALQALSSFVKIKGTLESPKISIDDKAALKSAVGVALSGPAYLGTKLVDVDPAPCYTALKGTVYQDKFPAPSATEQAVSNVYNDTSAAVDDSVKAVKQTVKGTAKDLKDTAKQLENTAKDILNMFKQ